MTGLAEHALPLRQGWRWQPDLAVLLLPPALLYSRSLSEVLVAWLAVVFLATCRDWSWLRRPQWQAAGLYWLWLVVCSAAGPAPWHAVPQALASLRYWLFAAALAHSVPAPTLRRLGWVVAACAGWIALECWQQYLFGANVIGAPRWSDGALTGPFPGPRAGPAFVLVLLPAMLPPAMALLDRGGVGPRLAGATLAAGGLVTLLLIGQRMPALLGLLGMLVCLLLLRRFRPVAIACLAAGAVLLAALPVVSPATYQKLVLHFLDQMRHFPQSPYGQIYARAAAIATAHPWAGQGFDGYRLVCAQPAYAQAQARFGLAPLAGPDEGCNIHPHQFWLEAASSAGLPGVLLFGAVVWLWLRRLGAGLWRAQDPLRVALFATVLGWLWPLASTSGFYNMPIAGWGFLLAGWGLALARQAEQR